MTLVLRNIDYDVSGLIFNDPKPSGHGGQTIYTNYQKDGRSTKTCLIQSPWLYNPFGLNSSPPQPGEDPKYYIELSFGNAPTAYVEDFHNKMKATDKRVIDAAIENQQTWLARTDVDQEYIDEFYKPIVRVYKNKEKKATGDYPDTIRFKVPYYTNKKDNEEGADSSPFADLEVYDANRNRIPLNTIDDLRAALGKGNRVRVITQFHSIWQTGQEFGVSWRVKRVQVLNNDSGLGEDCAFPAGSDDEAQPVSNNNNNSAPAAAFDDNNSDEEEA
jgi:hypothetical protein